MLKSRHFVLLLVLLGIVLLVGYVIFNIFGNNEYDEQQVEQSSFINKEAPTDKLKEEWTNYNQAPFDYVKTGSDPINFYIKPIYRKPYRYPYKFHSSYPYDHFSYGPNT